MKLRPGLVVSRQIARLDPVVDADEIARLSLVTLHGNPALTYALFTVAFMKQVAVPTMARILYRRGGGDIMAFPAQRNDDTLLFFGQLLDHGPTSPTGRAWIERLNQIHAHFPIRNDDSLYTLSTLALDPHQITSDIAHSPFTPTELEAQWHFWRSVAELQGLHSLPETREALHGWAQSYEQREFAPTSEGRAVARSLIDTFAERVLPRHLRQYADQIISAVCPPNLRDVHDLPQPPPPVQLAAGLTVAAYARSAALRLVDLERSMVDTFGVRQYGERQPSEVGYQRSQRKDHTI
ncbi:oxygenase MpaB family protein [Gordonia insulae]|uniref:ER-bound oxygenase mpaB/mpaB'/Rubber oxygenase catalytic domain-containing protein n=1 Tax=Gordonia insulae TaxID=2420509 RepID=A0A3G8JFF5_9ACTN|nr:oxygenase MpaB family protein [Gordonia insulae]AZG43817.1 hypothetical protein D7316_00387 [Gordonia insulae]